MMDLVNETEFPFTQDYFYFFLYFVAGMLIFYFI